MRWHHRLSLLILLLTCATAAHAQLSAYNTVALQSGGQAIPFPTVTVCAHVQPPTNPCTGTLATISSNSAGGTLTNPFQGDGAGNINFWANPGTYDISVAAPALNLPTNTYSFTLGNASGGSAFNAISSGTNTTAAMLVGTGASLAATGTGMITATAEAPGISITPSSVDGAIHVDGTTYACTYAGITNAAAHMSSGGELHLDACTNTNWTISTPLIFSTAGHIFWAGNGSWNGGSLSASITGCTMSVSLATCTTSANHGFQNGWSIEVMSVAVQCYDGVFTISGVTNTTFQYTADCTSAGAGAAGLAFAAPVMITGPGVQIDCPGGGHAPNAGLNGLPLMGNACALVATYASGSGNAINVSANNPWTDIERLDIIGNSSTCEGIALGWFNIESKILYNVFSNPLNAFRTNNPGSCGGGNIGSAVHFAGRISDGSDIIRNVIDGWMNNIWVDAFYVGTSGGTGVVRAEGNYTLENTGLWLYRASNSFDLSFRSNSNAASGLATNGVGLQIDGGTTYDPNVVNNHWNADNLNATTGITDLQMTGIVLGGKVEANSFNGNTQNTLASNDPAQAMSFGASVADVDVTGNDIRNYNTGGISITTGSCVYVGPESFAQGHAGMGSLFISNGPTCAWPNGDGTTAAPSINFSLDTANGFSRPGNNYIRYSSNGADRLSMGVGGIITGSNSFYGFSSGDSYSGTLDTGLSRISAGLVGVGTGTNGSTAGTLRGSFSAVSGGLLPLAAGGTDIGSTALPFGNLWLGTAATNNFKFAPAATAAQRVISIPDPLAAENLALIDTITVNVIPKAASSTTSRLSPSLATDNGTTMTYTGTGGYSAPVLVSTVATGTAPLTITSTTPVTNLTLSTASQVPSLPLNQIVSPTGAVATFADGNNPVTANCAQTTNNQDCWTFGETSAATGGTLTNLLANQAELHSATASGSTATPLEVEQAGCTATTCAPLAQFESTWNNASLVGQGIIENVTNTSSAAGSLLINLQVGNATVASVDKTGYTVESIASMTTGNQIISGADYTNSTTTPSTVFTWTLPATAAAKTYRYSCDMMWESTNTTLTGPQFGVNISAAPTQLTAANAAQNTLAGADINGYISNTTTGHQNVGVGTAAGVTNTNYWARMWGTIEGAPTAGSTFIIDAAALSNTTSTVNIRRGSSCQLTATN